MHVLECEMADRKIMGKIRGRGLGAYGSRFVFRTGDDTRREIGAPNSQYTITKERPMYFALHLLITVNQEMRMKPFATALAASLQNTPSISLRIPPKTVTL